ncbi:hypothetical protein [Brevundimonas sp.]|jgi:hypothetical protein|uniref:hypothetical protein n=1 Tax=Brevundimonas sp. TaxID=1871086 RepID=UPI0037BF90CC
MTDPAPAYRVRTSDTWDQARDAYLEGEAAESVCRRFGLSLSAFRKRAKLGGWRREDQADPEPVAPDAERPVPFHDFALMAETARRRVALALLEGRAAEALRWLRLFDTLSARGEADAPATEEAPDATSAETTEVHEVHEIHPVFSESPAQPAPTPEPRPAPTESAPAAPPPAVVAVLNRAKRRRQNRADRQQHRSSA